MSVEKIGLYANLLTIIHIYKYEWILHIYENIMKIIWYTWTKLLKHNEMK